MDELKRELWGILMGVLYHGAVAKDLGDYRREGFVSGITKAIGILHQLKEIELQKPSSASESSSSWKNAIENGLEKASRLAELPSCSVIVAGQVLAQDPIEPPVHEMIAAHDELPAHHPAHDEDQEVPPPDHDEDIPPPPTPQEAFQAYLDMLSRNRGILSRHVHPEDEGLPFNELAANISARFGADGDRVP